MMAFYYVLRADQVTNLRQMGWTNEIICKYDQYLYRRQTIQNRGRSAYKDSEKSKVYAAENLFQREHQAVNKNFASLEEAERYMNRVLASKTWQKISNVRKIELRQMRNGHNANAGLASYGSITLSPTFGFNSYVLLHEMAHCAGHMHHDVSFRTTLVKLVSRFLSAKDGEALKKCFKENGLKMHRKNSVLEPKLWLRSYNKMEAMRKYAGIAG